MYIETIFTSYQPIDQYYRLLALATGVKPEPAITLRGLDAFLMRQIAACYPVPPTVIDLGGAATLGASALFWAAQGTHVGAVYAGNASWGPTDSAWMRWVQDALQTLDSAVPVKLHFFDNPPDMASAWDALAPQLNTLTPLLISVAGLGKTVQDYEERLGWLVGLRSNTFLLALGVGETGTSPLIEAASQLCGLGTAWRVTLLREISPFFAISDLALIYPRENTAIPIVLKRLRDLYDGNFSFVSLMETNYKYFSETLKAQTQTVQLLNDAANPAQASQPGAATIQHQPASPMLRIKALGISYARRILRRTAIHYKATYLECSLPLQMQVNNGYDGSLRVRNDTNVPWTPPLGAKRGFSLAYHWRTPDGAMLIKEGRRSPLPSRIDPGQTVIIPFSVSTPAQSGDYVLELDLIHEGVAWFSDAGVAGPRFAVSVQP